MALNLANLNTRRLRDLSKCARLLGELLNFSVDVGAVQETYFTSAVDCRVLEGDNVVLSTYGSSSSVGIFLPIGRSYNTDVNLVLADDGCRLFVADVAVKSFEFRVAVVFAPNIVAERVSFFQQLALFSNDPKRIVLVGD